MKLIQKGFASPVVMSTSKMSFSMQLEPSIEGSVLEPRLEVDDVNPRSLKARWYSGAYLVSWVFI